MEFLPEQLQSLLQQDSVKYLHGTAQKQLASQMTQLRADFIQPYIIEPLTTLLALSASEGLNLRSIFILVLTIFMSLVILDYARRMVMFWVRLAISIVYWGSIIGAVWYFYRFGTENALRDGAWALSVVEGYVVSFLQEAFRGGDK